MKQKKFIIFIIAVVIVVAIIAIVVAVSAPKETENETEVEAEAETKNKYVEVLEDGTKVNTSEKLAETKTYNGLEFTDIKFTNSSSITNIYAVVTNTTSEDIDAQLVDINVLDEDGNITTTFSGTISALKAGESTVLNAGLASNDVDAYDIEIVAPQ